MYLFGLGFMTMSTKFPCVQKTDMVMDQDRA
jgi:hypothetical protein